MSIPHFRQDERAMVGPNPHDPSIAHQPCKILRVVTPIYGAHRYLIELGNGRRATLLEPTLRKIFQRSDWRSLKATWYGKPDCYIWQPKREAR